MRVSALKYLLIILCLPLCISSCKKGEGVGGQATIRGKVYLIDYNSTLTSIEDEYYVPKEDVYIIYGEGSSTYHDNVETHFDGSYEFRYLKKGTYQIYVYSKDTTSATGDPVIPIIKTVEITSKKETKVVEDIVIID